MAVDYPRQLAVAALELARHDEAFWGWVDRYPQAERAKGFLIGWSTAARLDPPPSDHLEPDDGLVARSLERLQSTSDSWPGGASTLDAADQPSR